MHVTLFVTCVVDLFQPEVGVAAVRVLRAGGCEVSCPLGQTCCGQPAWNSGHAAEAAKVARTTLDALESDGGRRGRGAGRLVRHHDPGVLAGAVRGGR